MRKVKKFFILLILAFALILVSVYFSVVSRQKLSYGVTFSQRFAEELGLDPANDGAGWKKLYIDILDDLKIRDVRLVAYWDRVEPKEGEFDFADLDWQVTEAGKRGAGVILAMGRKTPRWPECHVPNWVKSTEVEPPYGGSTSQKLLNYIKTIIERYRDNATITAWQVENEPLFPFGDCETTGIGTLNREIKLVRSLDGRPVLLTDAGEIGFAWPYLAAKSDIFGTTLYRYAHNRVLGDIRYSLIPPFYFKLKAWWANKVLGREILISELQAEPWVGTLVSNVSLEEQYKTMSPEIFKEVVGYTERSGFPKAYFWGVEWWYWMKEKKNAPEMWNAVKELVKNNP